MDPNAPPIATRVTVCAECHRAGERTPGESIDRDCRYCGADRSVQVIEAPSRRAARRILKHLLAVARRRGARKARKARDATKEAVNADSGGIA